MADKVWTNKDLKTSGPTTTYGPWKTTPKPKAALPVSAKDHRSGSLIDQMMAEQEAGTYVDPVQSAKETLARLDRADHLRQAPQQIANLKATSAQPLQAETDARRMSTDSGVMIDAAKKGLYMGAIPLSMTGGGLGLVAGGGLALNALNDFVENPGWGTGIGAALDVAPLGVGKAAKAVLRYARGGGKAAAEAPAIGKILQGAEAFDDVAPRTVRPSVPEAAWEAPGQYVPPAAAPAPRPQRTGTAWGIPAASAAAPQKVDDVAATIESLRPPSPVPVAEGFPSSLRGLDEAAVSRLDAHAPPATGPSAGPAGEFDDAIREALEGRSPSLEVVEEGPFINNASGNSAASVEALQRSSGMASRGEKFGYFDRSGKFNELIGPEAVDFVPSKGQTYGKMTPSGFETLTDMGGKVTQGRPPASMRHPAQSNAEEFGFADLGSISEGELARMQSQWPSSAGRDVPNVGQFEDYWKAKGRTKPFTHPKAPEKKKR